MKVIIRNIGSVSFLVVTLITLQLNLVAQTDAPLTTTTVPITTTTQTDSGNITEVASNKILVKTQGDRDPVPYRTTNTTTYVDDQGGPVPMEKVKAGRAAIIYFVTEGQNRVAVKIVILNAR